MNTIYIYENSATGMNSYTLTFRGLSFTDKGAKYRLVDELTRMNGEIISTIHEETATIAEYLSGSELESASVALG